MNPFSTKISLLIWLILFIPYMYFANFVMPGVQREIKTVADEPECSKALDIMIFGLNADSAQKSLKCMGENGRIVYRAAARKHDTAYPIIYTLFNLFTLFTLGSFLFGRKKFYVYLLLLPLLGMAFDFIENSQIVRLIDQFPDLDKGTVWLASLSGSIKWVLAFTNILIILVFAISSLVKLIRKR